MAVMSGASRGALRSGRYATRSMRTAASVAARIAATSTSGRATSAGASCTPGIHRYSASPPNAPSMKISPCAKLISWMTPYTIV